MNKIPDEVRSRIEEDCWQYRDKWHLWKSNLYGAMLTAQTLFIAVCGLAPRETLSLRVLESVITLTSLVAIVAIVTVCTMVIRMYDFLGFSNLPTSLTELNTWRDERYKKFHASAPERVHRKNMDKIILYCLAQNLALVGILTLLSIHR